MASEKVEVTATAELYTKEIDSNGVEPQGHYNHSHPIEGSRRDMLDVRLF